MNRCICEGCSRFSESCSEDHWLCAKEVYYTPSGVIPKHKFLKRSNFVTITRERNFAPEWCGFQLEQEIAGCDEKIDVKKFPENLLMYDDTMRDDF
jgi:hypothetical protein